MTLFWRYEKHEETIKSSMLELPDMLDGCSGLISTALLQIDLTSEDMYPVRNTLYWVRPMPCQFDATKIDEMPKTDVIGVADSE